MRILYISVHEVLEFDEVSLLRSLGHYVFSPGAYVEPENRGDHHLRPALHGLDYDPEDLRLYHACAKGGADNKSNLSRELVDRFDAVIYMHAPAWVVANWPVTKHKRVIWRTIGQSIDKNEASLAACRAEGLQIVRYSPAEERIPGYLGADAVIRFAKDLDEWRGWTGEIPRVVSVAQDPIKRGGACSYAFMEQVTRPFQRLLIGNGTEASGWGAGKLPYEDMKARLRESRCYFYTGTHPASYTLGFIEALMMGVPVVSIGPIHGNSRDIPGHRMFEVPEILANTYGFASDDPFELHDWLAALLRDEAFATKISQLGRMRAIELFGRERIAPQWKEFLGGL